MARIRTIKPEFPQSESLGRVSRDARLCFVNLWTICDDLGRARGNSRMLASLLFPYDDDAPKLIDGWMEELEREGAVIRYEVDGSSYVAITNWLKHQKIDKPSPSKLPEPREVSRTFSKSREHSSEDLGPRTSTKEGKGKDQGRDQARSACADEPIPLPACLDRSKNDDVTKAVEAYNAVARDLSWPEAKLISPARRSKLAGRLRDVGGLDGWRMAMDRARASPFLRGDSGRTNGHEGWAPDLDFFLQQSSFTKLMEGKYDGRQSANDGSAFFRAAAGIIAEEEDDRRAAH